MSETPSHVPVKYIMPKWIRGPQDFVGGLAMVAHRAVRVVGIERSAGHARIFVRSRNRAPHVRLPAARARHRDNDRRSCHRWRAHLTTYAWRGPLFVSLAILSFAATIRPMGLIFAAFASFMIAAMGSPETQWKETIIVGVCLTAFCSLLFPYALGLPLQMLPKFMIR